MEGSGGISEAERHGSEFIMTEGGGECSFFNRIAGHGHLVVTGRKVERGKVLGARKRRKNVTYTREWECILFRLLVEPTIVYAQSKLEWFAGRGFLGYYDDGGKSRDYSRAG